MDNPPTESKLDTIPKLQLRNADRFADIASIREKEFGIWQIRSWCELYRS